VKLPYRAGDSFAIPIGDGRLFPAVITACEHRVVEFDVYEPAGAHLASLRAWDRAFVLHRWKRGAPFDRLRMPFDELRVTIPFGMTIGPALAERIVATQAGIADLVQPSLLIKAGVFSREYPCIRTADDLAARRVAGLEYCIVAGDVDLRAVAAAFPNLRHLRIAGSFRVDARTLADFHELNALDLAGVELVSPNALTALRLRALRLARIQERIDLQSFASLRLRALSLEWLRDLRGVDSIAQWDSLEQLEMLGFWQLSLDDLMPLVDVANLIRAEIDIGGRRKNVELYRRANWAYPWPFEIAATAIFRAPSIARPERSG
jgi:hypothetical protein